jgi:hypothetical protein
MNRPLTQSELRQAVELIRERAYEFAMKVQPIFEANNWQWVNCGMRVPTVDDIFSQVFSLASDLKPGQYVAGWTGGRISVRIVKGLEENSEISIRIALVPFEITDTIERE